MRNFIIRTITGVFFVVAVVAAFLNPRAMGLLFALVTGLSVWEFTGLINNNIKGVKTNRFISTVSGVYLFLAVFGFTSRITPTAVFIPYLISIVYLMVSELWTKAENPIANWAYTMLSQMYIALPFATINILGFMGIQGQEGVAFTGLIPLCVFVFLWINDTGAYLCGSLLGKHKLFPRVSPGKSWEGSIGGGLLVLGVAALVWYLTDMYGYNYLHMDVLRWMGLGLTVVVFGTLGDLVESLLKRTIGIKDSGNILPGHGGMLDRFDSSLMAMPASVVYIYTLSLV